MTVPEGVRAQPTADDCRFIRRFPERCCAEVSRDGDSQPCDKTAVAVAVGDEDAGWEGWWPVCPHHSRGRQMVPLAILLAALEPRNAL